MRHIVLMQTGNAVDIKCIKLCTQCDLSHSFVYSKSLKEFDLEIALKWHALTLNAI